MSIIFKQIEKLFSITKKPKKLQMDAQIVASRPPQIKEIVETMHYPESFFRYLDYSYFTIVEETNNSNLPDDVKQQLVKHYYTIAHELTYYAYNDGYSSEYDYLNALEQVNQIRKQYNLLYDDGKKALIDANIPF